MNQEVNRSEKEPRLGQNLDEKVTRNHYKKIHIEDNVIEPIKPEYKLSKKSCIGIDLKIFETNKKLCVIEELSTEKLEERRAISRAQD